MSAAARQRFQFDELLRHLVTVGFAGLLIWAAVGVAGFFTGYLQFDSHQILKFLLAILILVFARRTYWEMCEWRWKHVPLDERYGFSSPLWETPRGNEHAAQGTAAATDPQQAAQ
jgi:hypothetical protein